MRSAWVLGLASLHCAACAVRAATQPAQVNKEACSSATSASVSAATREGLERATSSLEYENAWRAALPAASTGTIQSEEVRAIIRSHGGEIEGCYRAALSDSTESGGRVVVRFVIDQDGRVPAASVGASELKAPQLGCCVVERVAQWTFPAPENGSFVVVEYPFVVRLAR